MIRPILAIAAMLALVSPARADPNCLTNGTPGITIHFGVSVGGERSEDDQEVFDKMRLRQAGILADTVDRTWLGCFKVTRFEYGRWVTEYYDPDALEQGPLDLNLR